MHVWLKLGNLRLAHVTLEDKVVVETQHGVVGRDGKTQRLDEALYRARHLVTYGAVGTGRALWNGHRRKCQCRGIENINNTEGQQKPILKS